MEPMALKNDMKLDSDKTSGSSTADQFNNGNGEPSSPNQADLQDTPASDCLDRLDNGSTEELKNRDMDDTTANDSVEVETAADSPFSSSKRHCIRNQNQKVSPSIGAFTVQCANCFKWRLIPTMEKYEEIRERIEDEPFVCELGREWRPDISCDDPPDITQDGSRLWAIDKPSIPRAPPGWRRILRIRGEGGTKFADVYYAAPTGKRLRSLLEVQRFLNDHPKYVEEGLSMSRFSFQIPKPLQENYVQKRTPRLTLFDNGGQGSPQLDKVPEVLPLAWMAPDVVDTEMQLGIAEQPKKKKMPSKRSHDGELVRRDEVNFNNPFSV